jgi:hypothetical protein
MGAGEVVVVEPGGELAGWPTLALPRLRLPHPSRFSKSLP